MELYFAHFVIVAFLFLLLIRFLQIYLDFKKKTYGFPFYNFASYLLYCHVTGKIKKDTPTNNVAFERITELGKRHWKEGFFMTYLSQPVLFIYGEKVIKVFASEKAALDKSPEYEILAEALRHGLATSNGQRWKKHRKLINPTFHTGVLKEKVPLFNIHALNLITDMKKLVGKPSVDICEVLKFHFFNSLCESVLGLKQDEENREKTLNFLGNVDHLSSFLGKRFLYPWLRSKFALNFFPSGRDFIKKTKKTYDFVEKIISDMQKYVFSNNYVNTEEFGSHLQKSFTYLLLNNHLNDPTFTLDDVHSEVTTMIVAGYDTVTSSAIWCLYLLGLHPEIQEKIYNENEMLTSSYVTYEETANLTYLEAVIMECLRIFPVIPIYLRNLTDDIQYGKYKILKGTSIAFFPYLSHRNPEIFPDPEEFKPERFLNAETKKECSFIPFSEGSRNCIGKKYAIIELKIFLSHIIRNYKIISHDRREDVKLSYAVILLPVNRLSFKIENRQKHL